MRPKNPLWFTIVVFIAVHLLGCGQAGEIEQDIHQTTTVTAPAGDKESTGSEYVDVLSTPPVRFGGKSYDELENLVGWRLLRPRVDSEWVNSLIQRRLTELPPGIMVSETFTIPSAPDIGEIVLRQVPDPLSLAPPSGHPTARTVGDYDVQIYEDSGGVTARFLSGRSTSEGIEVLVVVKGESVPSVVDFIGSLVYGDHR